MYRFVIFIISVELFSLPVLATISFALSLMSVVFGFLLYKKCCACLRTMHLFMTIVTLQTTAGINLISNLYIQPHCTD